MQAKRSGDFREIMKMASLTAKAFKRDNFALISHYTEHFSSHTTLPICDDALIDPARPMCEPECENFHISDHHPNCSLFCLGGLGHFSCPPVCIATSNRMTTSASDSQYSPYSPCDSTSTSSSSDSTSSSVSSDVQ